MEILEDKTRMNTFVKYIDNIYESFYISNCLILLDDNKHFKEGLETILRGNLYPIEYGKIIILEYSNFIQELKSGLICTYDTVIIDKQVVEREGFSICSAFSRQDSLSDNLIIIVL